MKPRTLPHAWLILLTTASASGVAACGTGFYLDDVSSNGGEFMDEPNRGIVDPSFQLQGTGFNGTIYALAWDDTDQKLYVGGTFSQYNGNACYLLCRLNPDGSYDGGFAPTIAGGTEVQGIIVDNGNLYIRGNFNQINGSSRNYLARLSTTTGLPDGLNSGATDAIVSSFALAGGFLYVGGTFSTLAGTNGYQGLGRFNISSGTADLGWHPAMTGGVAALAISPNGIYAANNAAPYASKFMPNGANDPTFTLSTAPDAGPNALLVLGPDLFMGGTFMIGANHNLAKANALSGGVDTSWMPNPTGGVLGLAAWQNDIFVHGTVTNLGGRNYIAKMSPSGTVDTQWGLTFVNNTVRSIAFQGKSSAFYMGGSFTVPTNGVAKIR